jgi:hypothetical protein
MCAHDLYCSSPPCFSSVLHLPLNMTAVLWQDFLQYHFLNLLFSCSTIILHRSMSPQQNFYLAMKSLYITCRSTFVESHCTFPRSPWLGSMYPNCFMDLELTDWSLLPCKSPTWKSWYNKFRLFLWIHNLVNINKLGLIWSYLVSESYLKPRRSQQQWIRLAVTLLLAQRGIHLAPI